MGLIDEAKIAAAMEPVLTAVTKTVITELTELITQLAPQIQKGLTDALDGLTVTITFSKKSEAG
jgi:hypothetical protein